MPSYNTLLVICFITLATVGSDGQQNRNKINTLRTSISINDINNIAAASNGRNSNNNNSNYTKNVYKTNSKNNENLNSLNATIVMPITANTYPTTLKTLSSSAPSLSLSSSSSLSSSLSSPSLSSPSPVYVPSSPVTDSSSSVSSSTTMPKTVSAHAVASGSKVTETSGYRDKRGASLDPAEIARQNQITQQILSNYLERRLFPERSVSQKIPTIADILPKSITSTTTTKTPRQRARPRGFASSSSFKRGSTRRKTYGQSKKPNSLQHILKTNKNRNRLNDNDNQEEESQPADEELSEEPEVETHETETDIEDISSNKTLSLEDKDEEGGELRDEQQDDYDEPPPRYTSRHHVRYRHSQRDHSRRPVSYHQRYSYYDDDIEQDGQESLQSVESEQHDRYYKTKGDIFARDPSENEIDSGDCPHCVDETQYMNKWTMPLLKLGEKRYYLGIFFKANWFKATQYCRYHGMHLASISSQEENDRLEKHIKDFGLGHEHFWISGTDLADEGNFFWMATGRPITFTNWNAGEPNNFRYENGEEENCLELWNRDGKGLKWNDSPCSFETYFVCEVQP